jgi:hypothetical protein
MADIDIGNNKTNITPEKIKLMCELFGEIVVMIFNFINIFKKNENKN